MATDAHGRRLSDDGNYYWDGTVWQLVNPSTLSSGQQEPEQKVDAQGRQLSDDGHYYWDGTQWQPVDGGQSTYPPQGLPADVTQWPKEQQDHWFGNMRDDSAEGWSVLPTSIEVAEITHDEGTVGV